MKIDINCDMGESYGRFEVGNDAAIMPFITSANIACGFHAGDAISINRTIKLALKHKVAIGAHPGYPDIQGFGRRYIEMSIDEIKAIVSYQVNALKGITESEGGKLHHVKLHGALYNTSASDLQISKAICESILKIDKNLLLYGLPNSAHQEAAQLYRLKFIGEFFADRSYTNSGTLVPRSNANSVLSEEEKIISRIALLVAHKKVFSIDGSEVNVSADSICIHGDHKGSANLAQKIYNHCKVIGIKCIAPEFESL